MNNTGQSPREYRKKDLSLKILMEHNDVFAGILNAILFEGSPVITPEEIEDRHSVTSYNADSLHGMYRDVAKVWRKNQVKLCEAGFENQTEIDNNMIFRAAAYDGGDYRDQADREEPPVPVVTFVLYFGTKPWDAPVTLREAVQIAEDLEPYFSDYRLNVIDILHMSEEEVKKYKGDFGFLIHGMRDISRKVYDSREMYYLKHVREVLQIMNEFSIGIFENTVQSEMKEGYYSMISVLSEEEKEKIREECREEFSVLTEEEKEKLRKEFEAVGEEKGIAKGKAEGKAESVKNLIRNMNLSSKEAMRMLGIPEEEQKAVLEQIGLMS